MLFLFLILRSLACENGHAEIVKLLINDRRVNVNAQDEYAIKQACEENHYQVLKILLDHPAVNYQRDIYSPVVCFGRVAYFFVQI